LQSVNRLLAVARRLAGAGGYPSCWSARWRGNAGRNGWPSGWPFWSEWSVDGCAELRGFPVG